MPSSTVIPAAIKAGRKSVLVSGASFAGLATAYWLNRLGHSVTIVETASELRRGGTPVDIEGETIEILSRMGLADAVRAKALPPRGFEFKDADDATLGSIGIGNEQEAHERYEIHRDDLLDILSAAVEDKVEILFGQSIVELDEGTDGVSVTFSNGDQRDYALVFGCDGNRSNTRKLVFGEGEQFAYFMGGYFFLKVVPHIGLLPANMSQVFSVPGRMAMLNGYEDRTDIGFGFRTIGEIDYNYRDRAQQRRLPCQPKLTCEAGEDTRSSERRIWV
jgi:2-polyprenyl-6-methoxyphenol hydroxylase-like FAD-dependent oxidoreductase